MDALSSIHSRSPDTDSSPAVPDAPCANALPPGTRLQGVELISVLGQGGFSIVYAAMDTALQRPIAVKEYMPASFASRADSSQVILRSQRHKASFEAGLHSFIEEARLLAQFKHPALVEVLSFWEENGTAYMAMPLYQGRTLRHTLREQSQQASEGLLRKWLAPVLDVLEMLHEQQVFHRDIAPDNIIIQPDGRPVLLDLGSARRVVNETEHAPTVVVKAGYAPIEQYAEDRSVPQGAWTDVYALGALLYYAVTGRAPTASVSRMMKDTLVPLTEQKPAGYSHQFLAAIDHALALQPTDRPQSIAALREALGVHDAAARVVSLPAPGAAAVPDYEDEEKTVILSAEELEQLMRPGQRSVRSADTDEDLPATAAEAEPERHAFADMEEFLNPPPSREIGQMLVPGKTTDPDISAAVAEADRPTAGGGSGTALLWLACLACIAVLAVAIKLLMVAGTESSGSASGVIAAGVEQPVPSETPPLVPVTEPSSGSAQRSRHHAPVVALEAVDQADAISGSLLAEALSQQVRVGPPMPEVQDTLELRRIDDEPVAIQPPMPVTTVRLDSEPDTSQAPEVPTGRPAAPLPRAAAAPAASPRRTTRAEPAPRAEAAPRIAATGTVALNILPWGEVWVDGVRKGVAPPLRALELPVGRHSIEIRNPGFPSLTHSVNVTAGTTPEIVHEFISASSRRDLEQPDEPVQRPARQRQSATPSRTAAPAVEPARAEPAAFGYADIRVRPWAEVWVDGKKQGVAPPLNELKLPEGLYRIEFRNPDYPSVVRSLRVSSAQRSTVVQFFD